MSEIQDDAFLGNIIISFNTAILAPLPGSSYNELTTALILKILNNEVRVVKFITHQLNEVTKQLKYSLDKFPDADQRENVEKLLQNRDYVERNIESLSRHPIIMYLQNVPNPPHETQRALPSQYVNFTHINAYPNIFKFDFTFADASTSRFSIDPAVAIYLLESLEDTCSELNKFGNKN